MLTTIKNRIISIIRKIILFICKFFPIQNKVYFSNFTGKRYGDNPRFISEKLHQVMPECQIVWQKLKGYSFEDVPDYVNVVKYGRIKAIYEMATSKVWVDSHLKELWIIRKCHFFYLYPRDEADGCG